MGGGGGHDLLLLLSFILFFLNEERHIYFLVLMRHSKIYDFCYFLDISHSVEIHDYFV